MPLPRSWRRRPWGNGKDNGNYYYGCIILGYIGIMENKMEATRGFSSFVALPMCGVDGGGVLEGAS